MKEHTHQVPTRFTGTVCVVYRNPCVSSPAVLGYWAEVWTLCEALWGQLGPADQDPDTDPPSDYEQQLQRRRTFSAWLSRGAACRVDEEVALAGKGRHTEAIFSYLTGNCISEACRVAQKEGEEVVVVRATQRELRTITGDATRSKSCSVTGQCLCSVLCRRPPPVPAAVPGHGFSVLSGSTGPSARGLEPHADRQLPARGATPHLRSSRRETSEMFGLFKEKWSYSRRRGHGDSRVSRALKRHLGGATLLLHVCNLLLVVFSLRPCRCGSRPTPL